jgi:hypothetical protein
VRVSFDLDDTLVCGAAVTAEPLGWVARRLAGERLRKGTRALFAELRTLGFEPWVYTTSERSEASVRRVFRWHGLRLGGVVNAARHHARVQRDRSHPMPSKYPPRFQIALHVDDDPSVLANGERFGFRVVLVAPGDEAWAEKVLVAARRLTPAVPPRA